MVDASPSESEFNQKLQSSSGSARKNILFATTVLPGGTSTGGEIVSRRVIEGLSQLGCTVKVLGYARDGYSPSSEERLVETRVIESKLSPIALVGWVLQAGLSGRAISIQKYHSRSYLRVIEEEFRRVPYDAVIVDHAQASWILPHVKGRVVLHMCHNAEAELYRDSAKLSSGFRRRILEREARLIGSFECQLAATCKAIWTLTEADAEYFRGLGAQAVRVLQVPGLRVSSAARAVEPVTDVAILGTWTWKPNRTGLDWFVRDVMGRLPGDVRVQVGGTGADDLRGRFPNLEILGRVPSAAEFLGRAKCIAIPSLEGAGLQVKTLDALAVGRPVVATSFACRGIVLPDGGVRVEDAPDRFAEAVVDWARKPAQRVNNDWTERREATFLSELEQSIASF